MTATERAKRSDSLYYETVSVTRRVLCDMIANREADLEDARADNAKLRELVEDMHAALQAFCDAQDVHGDNCPLWVERTDDCELRGIERRMRELGVDA